MDLEMKLVKSLDVVNLWLFKDTHLEGSNFLHAFSIRLTFLMFNNVKFEHWPKFKMAETAILNYEKCSRLDKVQPS